MEKFVLRGDDALAAAEAAQQPGGSGVRDRQRLRQTRIADGTKVVVEDDVRRLRDELDAARTPTAMLRVLLALEREHFVSLEILEKTRIGVSLTRLQRRAEDDDVRARATLLLREWKVRAKKALRRRARRVETFGRNFAD
ncbi:hypothetical protein PybrP1_012117 [[Pythium] brassicae (nom. inval.)]|nr:hypothetical protein PybrP1_012117 [[Pythium] brassicae (nom. inval.)]